MSATQDIHSPPTRGPRAPTLSLLRQVRIDRGARSVDLDDRRAAALLAVIAIDGSAWAHRMANLLWPQAQTAQALMALDALRVELADTLGIDLIRGVELLHLAPEVAIQVGLDDQALDALGNEAAPHVLSAYLYDDLEEVAEWVGAAQQRLLRVARMQYIDRSFEHELRGDIEGAVLCAQRALALDPRCEDCLRRLMKLHARVGHRAAALTAFARSDALMRARHGTALSAELHALANEIAGTASMRNNASPQSNRVAA